MIKEHHFSIEIPHAAERIWSLMQDYDKWLEFTKAIIINIEVLYPGDEKGNGLVRRVQYKLPWGSRCSIELVTEVKENSGYRYTMLGREPGLDTNGEIRLEKKEKEKTIVHFIERFNLKKLPFIYRLLGNRIYKFINKRNEETFNNLSSWLDEHPDYPKK